MIPSEHAHIYTAALTHPGMRGKNNEDRYAVSAFWTNADARKPSVLAIVADGIGGHRAGEVAAEIVVDTLHQLVADSNAENPLEILQKGFAQANQAVFSRAQENRDQMGMGSTCVCAWIIDDRLFAASVGDSRLYLLRGNRILQLTTDHTWIQEAIQYKIITPEEAHHHPNAHVIRRYLGSEFYTQPDFRLRLFLNESDEESQAHQGMRLLPGDSILLCSDGLTDLVEEHEIRHALRTFEGEKALAQLIGLANKRGGHDNITTVLLEMPDQSTAEAPKRSQPLKNSRRNLWIAGSVVLFLMICLGCLVMLLLTLLWFSQPRPDVIPIPTSISGLAWIAGWLQGSG